MFMIRTGTISSTAGAGLELESVAAAVVGGVSILGGSGTMIGALLGAILIDTLKLSLVRVPEVSEFWRDAALGILILGAVVLDASLHKRFAKRWSAEVRQSMGRNPDVISTFPLWGCGRCVNGWRSIAGRHC